MNEKTLHGPPLNFSFRSLNTIKEVLEHRPRIWTRQLKKDENGKYLTRGIQLNNNLLTSLEGFTEVAEKFLAFPEDISWIDISFNHLTSIESILLNFPNLRILYLHGNNINRLSQLSLLTELTHLKKLTLFNNPVETLPFYRMKVLGYLPNLKSLDFSGVTLKESERASREFSSHLNP
ncbi:leucine-rich repeat-containing protein 51-like [Centruroides sculpturatus]|uniref:leucine-rich repeat-containing protein 51-like n=1 Tax=Centruroides sculpturatus TaxID=218467 RepID=UPI000C6CDB40|nr:leucine-rich repeat-containing protein 51-like [Centruroides sculpturatus]XP_023236008.1 leucine-rich repeat-containing protein 51-like [Centruroides sculpturatus]XP_023236070.1 leucine-rich repeat-containing protein 51-like [Centruroides sculpturatus]XP_023236175.1 leucine-rich repeat-containing protein 51-like [Centruroides sculpturatus]